jgi:hypothetical protein
MAFDLSRFDTTAACDKGAEIELKDPVSNAPTGMFITLLGSDSTAFREYTRNKTNERLRKESIAAKRGKDAEIRTVEAIEQENLELLVSCTKGWRGILVNGAELAFNVPNALQVYRNYPKIYEQVNDAIGDLGNFMKS